MKSSVLKNNRREIDMKSVYQIFNMRKSLYIHDIIPKKKEDRV